MGQIEKEILGGGAMQQDQKIFNNLSKTIKQTQYLSVANRLAKERPSDHPEAP